MNENYAFWPIEALACAVQSKQEKMVSSHAPFLRERCELLCDRYKRVHPELAGVSDFAGEVLNRLESAFMRDSQLYFPYIERLAECHRTGDPVEVPLFSSLCNIIHQYRKEQFAILQDMHSVTEMVGTAARFPMVKGDGVLEADLRDFCQELDMVCELKLQVLFHRAIELESTVARSCEQLELVCVPS